MNLVAIMFAAVLFGAATTHATAGWYISIGAGMSDADTMRQSGNNDDTTCYPGDVCRPGFTPDGYRWRYDLRPESGVALEPGVGYDLRLLRLELTTTRQTLGIDQQFVFVSYLDGARVLPDMDSLYTVDVKTGADELTLHTLSVNAYSDLHVNNLLIKPYLGFGLGLAFARLSGLLYEAAYAVEAPPEHEALHDAVDPSVYDGRQHIEVLGNMTRQPAHRPSCISAT